MIGSPSDPTELEQVIDYLVEGVTELICSYVIAYIDDILIYSNSLEDHVHHVRTVLSRLLQHNLYVKIEKCEFH
ncbi:hypothetical protein QTP86_024204 [Hemibagrus guttatus]|nr:hypothetical protein QTP86_024204 [Hemibagrus guttatus]